MTGSTDSLMARIDAARNGHETAKGQISEARGMFGNEGANQSENLADSPESMSLSDVVHLGLDIAGFIPGIGIFADGANALLYLAEGRETDAAISAAATVFDGASVLRYAGEATGVVAAAAGAARRSPTGIGRDPGLSSEATEAISSLQNIRDNVLGKINKQPGHNHYDAARREAAGEIVSLRPDGRPHSHIGELQEAYGGLKNVREALAREIRKPPSTISERGIEVLYEQRRRVNHEITELRRFLNEIGHPP